MNYKKILFTIAFSMFGAVMLLGNPSSAEAAIAFKSATTTNNTSSCNTQSVTVNVPAGVTNGDVMIVGVQYGGSTQMTTPAGWTLINHVNNSFSTTQNLTTFYRVASSEPASYTWTMPSLVCWITAAAAYSGVDNSTPIDAQTIVGVNTGTSLVANAVTTTKANDTIVTIFAGYNGTSTTWTPPAGQTERVDSNNTSVRAIELNDSTQASVGSSGTFTATASVSNYGANATIALKPLSYTPTVTSPSASSITASSATLNGNVTTDGGSTIMSRGACYNTDNFATWTSASQMYGANGNVAVSSSGQYVTSINGGILYVSSNYGSTASTYNSGQSVIDVDMSSSGQYQAFVTSSNYVWYSSNYGSTFTSVALTSYQLKSISVSDSGQYMLISAKTGSGSHISLKSSDYGATWPTVATIDATTNSAYSTNDVSISGDGTRALAVIINPGGVTYAGNMYTSSNGGVTWTYAFPNSPTGFYNATGISSDGKYQYGLSSRSASGYDFIAYSSDFGVTWASVSTPAKFNRLANSSDGKTLLASSTSGQLYVSYDYGLTWTVTGPNTTWAGVGLSKTSSKYMFAATTGGTVYYSSDYGRGTSTCQTTSGTTGTFSVSAPSLIASTTYYYYAFADNAVGRGTTSIASFTTLASTPTIGSPTSASITATSATLGGNITSAGSASITARGVCYAPTSTDADPRIGDTGVICIPEGGTTTGVFTVNVSNLQGNTGYSYNAYATNSVGTSYVLGTFTTLNPAPTTVSTATNGTPQSYYVTLNGSANPNGYQTYGHFRVFTTNPGNCSSDSGGTRYPEGVDNGRPDLNLGSGTSVVSAPIFSYTIPLDSSKFLEPNTTYYYCAYAVNTVNSINYTTGASQVVSFTTPDGPASPCDPPTNGNLSIPSGAVCNFVGTVGGVDAGTGTRNTAQLTIPSGTRLTISAGQKIAFGSISLARGAILSIARGGSLLGGGVFVHDSDRDNYLDDATQYVGSTASAATEFVRRNAISSIFNYSWKIASSGAVYDCNKNSAYAYRVLPNLVRDADNDGYKTATAAGPQCVGASAVFNGRTYYNDGSGPN